MLGGSWWRDNAGGNPVPYFALSVAVLAVAAEPGPIRLAAPDLGLLNVSQKAGAFYLEHLSQQLATADLKVTTAAEIASLLGMERQRQLLDCDASSSCTVELASALGVDGILKGSVGNFDGTYQVNLAVISARDAQKLATFSASAESEKELIEQLTVGAGRLREQLRKALRPAASLAQPGEAPAGGGGARRWWWVPAGVGVASAAVGAVFLVQASQRADALRTSNVAVVGADPVAFAGGAKDQRAAGVVLASVGAAALLSAGALALFGDGEAPKTTVTFAPLPSEGVVLGVSGVLP